jgi:hypothetical protein
MIFPMVLWCGPSARDRIDISTPFGLDLRVTDHLEMGFSFCGVDEWATVEKYLRG